MFCPADAELKTIKLKTHNLNMDFNVLHEDEAEVTIGDDCNFGPNVTIVTPVHPMLPNECMKMRTADGEIRHLCYAKPVMIGNDCWFGAGVTVCHSVNIGNNCVIGAGSVVTHDIPNNSFAAGVPCHVIREITDADSMKYLPDIIADNTIIYMTEQHHTKDNIG